MHAVSLMSTRGPPKHSKCRGQQGPALLCAARAAPCLQRLRRAAYMQRFWPALPRGAKCQGRAARGGGCSETRIESGFEYCEPACSFLIVPAFSLRMLAAAAPQAVRTGLNAQQQGDTGRVTVILLTDGRANVSLAKSNEDPEALKPDAPKPTKVGRPVEPPLPPTPPLCSTKCHAYLTCLSKSIGCA